MLAVQSVPIGTAIHQADRATQVPIFYTSECCCCRDLLSNLPSLNNSRAEEQQEVLSDVLLVGAGG